MEIDSYRTIKNPVEAILFKDRKSKFFGYAYTIENEEDIKEFLHQVAEKHPTANHVCYAWQMGVETISYRANDDGEPNNSAGMPIYGQIQAHDLTNVLVAVARVFGGTKLGVGGLIQAYKETAKLTLEQAAVITKIIEVHYQLDFEYDQMNNVMSLLKRFDANIVAQEMHLNCSLEVALPKKIASQFEEAIKEYHKVSVKSL